METLGAVLAGVLFWLPRIAVISLVLSGLIWLADKGVGWLLPQRGDPAPEFETGSADQNALYARLLQAEFMQIKEDLASGAATVNRLLQAWTTEFNEINRKKQARSITRQLPSIVPPAPEGQARVIPPSAITAPVDLERVADVVEHLKLLSSTISGAKVPDIKIASVELGPVLRWVVDMLRPASENKVVVFDESSAALIEGPIVSGGRTVLEFEASADPKKRTAREIVTPVAYEILASKLASTAKIDFGGWAVLRDFVVGTKAMAKLVSQPQPGQEDRADWDRQVANAAHLIERAGAAAQDWNFIALASFLFERSRDFDNAIRVLDHYAEFTRGNAKDEEGRSARLAYLRDRRVESAVASALDGRKGDGAAFAATAIALSKLPSMVAARKMHRLDGASDRAKVRVAIVSGAKPRWFGLDGPPEALPIDDFLDLYGAQLAQVVRALSPSADLVFVPVEQSESEGSVRDFDLLKAVDAAAKTDAPIILLPFGPIKGAAWDQVSAELIKRGQLLIVPAGNDGAPVDFPKTTDALVAESLQLDGRRSEFSSQVKGSLGAVGELPVVDLTEGGPTVALGTGTSYAAAALAAVAAESIARQQTLKGAALRDALISAAAHLADGQSPPVARVVIPR